VFNSYRFVFLGSSGLCLAVAAIYLFLSPAVEIPNPSSLASSSTRVGPESKRIVAKITALFSLDAFGGGFLTDALVAYWFFLRWGFDPGALAVIFFWVGVLSGLSLLAAGWLAERIGLLNTMVVTHLPSQVLLVLVPLAPVPWLAVALFLARMSISQMDVPTRQSYAMAVVDPDERTATAGITNVARTTATAISPTFAGIAFSAAAFGLPFFIAGALKIVYDVAIYFTFRNVLPPEEVERLRRRERGRIAATGAG